MVVRAVDAELFLRAFDRPVQMLSAHAVIPLAQIAVTSRVERGVHMLHIVMEIVIPGQVVVLEPPDAVREMGRIGPPAFAVGKIEA